MYTTTIMTMEQPPTAITSAPKTNVVCFFISFFFYSNYLQVDIQPMYNGQQWTTTEEQCKQGIWGTQSPGKSLICFVFLS